jgi:hypothetical protein
MGIVHPEARATSASTGIIPEGFPVPTHEFRELSRQVLAEVESAAENLTLVGKAGGKAFFTKDVLVAAHGKLANLPSFPAQPSPVAR